MDVKQIGMIGAGSMGSMMSLLFAELGIDVHFYDPSDTQAESLLKMADDAKLVSRIHRHKDYKPLCEALQPPRAFVFSTPHGKVGDVTIQSLLPHLSKGDVLMDAANELWTNTERRQKELEPRGIHFVGMGVSGGYQSARHGPSISPGGSREALDLVFPFLETICAKDRRGRACVAKLGPGGCGHYVKMIHNGIEQGLMTALCEVWGIMRWGLGMGHEEIGAVLDRWNTEGDDPLRDNYLIGIGADICRTRDEEGNYVLDTVRDKVVQDVDNSEGTGTWAMGEGVRLHVPIPTLAAAHLFRCGSAHAEKRAAVAKALGGSVEPGKITTGSGGAADNDKLLQDLHDAAYAAFLMSFAQGLHTLALADEEQGWRLSYPDVLQIWRGGCIIQSDAIVDLLDAVYRTGEGEVDRTNLLAHPCIAEPLRAAFPALKRVVLKAVEADLVVPALSASLEFYKYSGSNELPTQFQEAQLDYFGEHMYDYAWEGPGEPRTGSHHYEWKPARVIRKEGAGS